MKAYRELYGNTKEFRAFMNEFNSVCDLLETTSLLTIAMVNGVCVAGGLEIALACDLVTISKAARIGDGHLKFGQLPGAGGSQRLVRALGPQRAKYWLLSARLFDAEEAVDVGLAVEAIDPDRLLERTMQLVDGMLSHSSLARKRMKQLIRIAVDTHQSEGLLREIDVVLEYAHTSSDAREGLDAFVEQRAPRFVGS
jgi:enoyl-CoA hydratase